MYDYLIVGSGLYGSTCAHELKKRGKRVLVIEQRDHIGGNIFTENNNGIQVHKYGAHIFHTNNREIWNYVNQFAEFNRYTNSPVANYKGKIYNLPFNMNTFNQLWGAITPEQAQAKIAEQQSELGEKLPKNLEEQAIRLVGRDIYEKLVKGYTEKQWGRPATELPAFIIKRLPVRFTYDNNYFNDKFQGIPIGGYTQIIEKMLAGIEVRCNTDYFHNRKELDQTSKAVIYSGPIDRYFGYCYGKLEYRSLRFETETINKPNVQGNAVVNYTEREVPYTRIIEHKHFDPVDTPHSVITHEYPAEWTDGLEPYYPINNDKNDTLYRQYRDLSKLENNIFFGGRLAEYRYYDMHQIIASALNDIKKMP
ncbi:UDP-galactopyranose mutase [Zhongshania sp. BJYM1]|uniref:UDP-galactopyranose mutase n=1 Tax=Zhongshania aquatica TaxID=2965069 RepID=UPI0022B402C6|nr:UDP-galactopyranose mutase [Marortus sp. BJYM1]